MNLHKTLPFDTLHKARFEFGTLAQRPAVPEGVGDAYWSTDTQELYCTDAAGTAWVLVSGGSGGSSSGSAHAIKVYRANVTIPANSGDDYNFNPLIDTDGYYEAGLGNIRIPVGLGGLYVVMTSLSYYLPSLTDVTLVSTSIRIDGYDVDPEANYGSIGTIHSHNIYQIDDSQRLRLAVNNSTETSFSASFYISAYRIGDI